MGRKTAERRNFWNNNEIRCMLEIIKEIQKKRGTTATTHYTFIEIDKEMKRRGFTNKSAIQIRRKWFQMKSAYHCAKKGNVDRLLLIPEEFREEIKFFVESETKGFKEITLTSQESEFFTSNTKTKINREICSDSISSKNTNHSDNSQKDKYDVNTFANSKKQQQRKKKLPKIEKQFVMSRNDTSTKNVYQKKFAKFYNRLENVEESIHNEFIRQQWELMQREHQLQAERDKNLIDAFVQSTYEILNASQLFIKQLYSTE